MKNLFSFLILGSLFLVFASSAAGQSLDAKSLKGIERIEILVENINPETQRYVSKSDLTNVIRRGLVSRGIAVTNNTGNDDRYNYLYLNLNLLTDGRGIYFNARLEFNQMVTLGTGESHMAATWAAGGLSVGPISSAREQILKDVEALVDKFVIDYFAGNR